MIPGRVAGSWEGGRSGSQRAGGRSSAAYGHTDDVGGDDYNQGLSTDRANSVRLWLIEKEKIDPSILDSIGYGETKPIASNRTAAGRQQNRRVDFRVERTDEVKEVPMAPTP